MTTLNHLLTDDQAILLMDDKRRVPEVYAIYGDWAVASDGVYSLTEFHPIELFFLKRDDVIARTYAKLPIHRRDNFTRAVADARFRFGILPDYLVH